MNTATKVGLGLLGLCVTGVAIDYKVRQRRLAQDYSPDAINGQRYDDAVMNTDWSYLFDFDSFDDEEEAKELIRKYIYEIVEENDCFYIYIGGTEDELRLMTHEKGRFKKLFLLTTITEFSKIKEIEEYFITDIALDIINGELNAELTNKNNRSTGLKPGASEYYLYIAICDANQA